MKPVLMLENIAIELDEIAVGLSCLAEQNEGEPGGAILDSYSRYIDRIGRDVGQLSLDLMRTRCRNDASPDPEEDDQETKRSTIWK